MELAIRNRSPMPSDLTDVLICEAMHWSWQELMETPPHVVDDVRVLLQKRGAIAQEERAAREARSANN